MRMNLQKKASSPPKKGKIIPITAGGGIVFKSDSSEIHVLLIKRNGFWDLPKGKLEPGESIPACAVREVSEEVGIIKPAIVFSLPNTYHEYSEKGKEFGKTTFWYGMIEMQQGASFTPQKKEGIETVLYTELTKAIEMVAFETLKNVLKHFQEVIVKKKALE